MKKKFYLPLMACLLLIGATGCSSDSDVNEPARQDLTVTYYLTNEAGEVKTTFSYGEEIFFHLTVGNNTDATVTFSSLEDLYGSEWTLEKEDEIVNAIKNSLFAVYTAQGQFVGNPWTLIDSKECVSIKPQQSVEIAIPWQKYSRRTIQLARKYSKFGDYAPLQKGSYYTQHTLYRQNAAPKTYKAEFKVQ